MLKLKQFTSRLSLVLLLALFTTVLPAVAEQNDKIVLHLNDKYKLGHLKNSVKNIRTELGENVDIKVIINGKAVQLMIKSNKSSVDLINDMLGRNADIGLCHNAVRNNKVDRAILIPGIKVLPEDGNVTILNLQKQGYSYIKM